MYTPSKLRNKRSNIYYNHYKSCAACSNSTSHNNTQNIHFLPYYISYLIRLTVIRNWQNHGNPTTKKWLSQLTREVKTALHKYNNCFVFRILFEHIGTSFEKQCLDHTSAVFIDNSKAFDKVWHSGLIFKKEKKHKHIKIFI